MTVLYLATASSPKIRDAIAQGELGQITGPGSNRVVPGARVALDNGTVRIIDGAPVRDPEWSADKWRRWLDRQPREHALFAVVPDWVGDAERTDDLWARYRDEVVDLGYVPAYVAQNGCAQVPDDAGALFIGGDDAWKESDHVAQLVDQFTGWSHLGRVNTLARLRYAARQSYDSVDGTLLAFGPDRNLAALRRWLFLANHPTLWENH